MRKLESVASYLVGKLRKWAPANNAIQYLYLSLKFQPRPSMQINGDANSHLPKVAFICDEMTWCDFSGYCNAVFLHPKTWRKQLALFQPSLVFCESAWSGIEKYKDCWRARVYKDKRVSFENRKEIIRLLAYCEANGIYTAFWNKEDPAFFEHEIYDFVDTALKFQYVFTTAEECVEKYQKLGHDRVYCLPFGVNTELFTPTVQKKKENGVLFAGSWYGDNPERCKALSEILDYVIGQGMDLDIYDRQSNAPEKKFRFPEKYRQYIRPQIAFRDIPALTCQYPVCINVNTVTESSTMFSRRVLQTLACGTKILSNQAEGFRGFLHQEVAITQINDSIIELEGNLSAIHEYHATRSRLKYVLDAVGCGIPKNEEVAVGSGK